MKGGMDNYDAWDVLLTTKGRLDYGDGVESDGGSKVRSP
jgi:hypothetical protein